MKFMVNGKPFGGLITALVTPFNADNIVDDVKMEKLVNFQIECGVDGLLVLGGSGEYVSLSQKERLHAIKSAVKAAAGRVPIISGVLEPGLADAIDAANAFSNVGAVIPLVLTPYYVNPTQDGIFNFFRKFDEAYNRPFLVYNIPYKNATDVKPSTFEKIVNVLPNCAGIKECSPSFADCVDIICRVGDKCTVMSGEDLMAGGHILFGAEAAIIASANLIPDRWVELFRRAKDRDIDAVIQFQRDYYPLFELLFAEINPGPLKYAMGRIGVDVGEVCTPLVPCSESLKVELDSLMKKLRLI